MTREEKAMFMDLMGTIQSLNERIDSLEKNLNTKNSRNQKPQKTTQTQVTTQDNTTMPVNNLTFNEDLQPSQPKKAYYKKSNNKNNNTYEDFINQCIKGEKKYPDKSIKWNNEIQHINGLGYIAVLDEWITKDLYNVLKFDIEKVKDAKIYNKNGFLFKTKKACEAFILDHKNISGKYIVQVYVATRAN